MPPGTVRNLTAREKIGPLHGPDTSGAAPTVASDGRERKPLANACRADAGHAVPGVDRVDRHGGYPHCVVEGPDIVTS